MSRCMASVNEWSQLRGMDYRFFGDEIFDLLPKWYLDACKGHKWPMSDLARLLAARNLLAEGYSRVIWCDADLLVFDPESLNIDTTLEFAFCREPWMGPQDNPISLALKKPGHIGRIRHASSWKGYYTSMNVNNAFFVIGDSWFLDHYINCVLYSGRKLDEFRSQHMGPDMLTALYGVLKFPLLRHVGAFSLYVVRAIANEDTKILGAYSQLAGEPLYAANVCNSQFAEDQVIHDRAIELLIETKGGVINRHLTTG